jgi:hypothetical protein
VEISLLFVRGYISRKLCWFRFPKRGFAITRMAPLFSERYGHEKSVLLLLGWRLKKLQVFR